MAPQFLQQKTQSPLANNKPELNFFRRKPTVKKANAGSIYLKLYRQPGEGFLGECADPHTQEQLLSWRVPPQECKV